MLRLWLQPSDIASSDVNAVYKLMGFGVYILAALGNLVTSISVAILSMQKTSPVNRPALRYPLPESRAVSMPLMGFAELPCHVLGTDSKTKVPETMHGNHRLQSALQTRRIVPVLGETHYSR
jgi:hypothetical protein